MAEYILFMHNDVVADDLGEWESYLQTLKQTGAFEGGSEIGDGICVRKAGAAPPITEHLGGYIRVTAATIDLAKSLLVGNPHFEAGGRWKYASYRGRKRLPSPFQSLYRFLPLSRHRGQVPSIAVVG